MNEVLLNLLIIYSIGFFTTLGVSSVFNGLELGFRTRITYSSLWFIWIILIILSFIFALIYAFIKNSAIEEGLEKATEVRIISIILNSLTW